MKRRRFPIERGWRAEWPVHLPVLTLPNDEVEGQFHQMQYDSADYPSRAKARARARREAKDPSHPVSVAYIQPFHTEEFSFGRKVRVFDGEREEVSA